MRLQCLLYGWDDLAHAHHGESGAPKKKKRKKSLASKGSNKTSPDAAEKSSAPRIALVLCEGELRSLLGRGLLWYFGAFPGLGFAVIEVDNATWLLACHVVRHWFAT